MTKLIVAEPSSGLGNRLRCIGSLMRIARRIRSEFALSWPVTADLPAPFEDFFDEPLSRLRSSSSKAAEEGASRRQDEQTLYLRHGCNVRVITADQLLYPTIHARAAYLYLIEAHPGEPEPRTRAMQEAGEILAGFQLNPYVAARLEEASRTFDVEHRVGIHVRRGDVSANRRVELRRYFETVDQKYADAPLFVASDDQRVLETFGQRFGSRVAVFEARSRHRHDRTAAQDALIEMLLLARARRIVTGLSSFTEVAAMIGGVGRDILRPE
jgi:hypothetical protein